MISGLQLYSAISRSQPADSLICSRVKTQPNQRERATHRESSVQSVCSCVPLISSPLHTPRPRAHVAARAEAGSTGVKELEAGPGDLWGGAGGREQQEEFPSLSCWTSNWTFNQQRIASSRLIYSFLFGFQGFLSRCCLATWSKNLKDPFEFVLNHLVLWNTLELVNFWVFNLKSGELSSVNLLYQHLLSEIKKGFYVESKYFLQNKSLLLLF